ncbi:hypothetical protein [Oceanicoccus sagamiensis]|uniref:Right handed beta helix domain-containing protein n=1 Tax=Oceanicoccus sagamiensis TaxID=716816 RepID=A0A1X9N9S1_9GAMM|nr:hypothetical protein [Oceanicoccus sagamiensis]ARN74828.1 hypothetical protein BST96_12300 [Oceanicoccus sagamiensis]
MKNKLIYLCLIAATASSHALASSVVHDEDSLLAAIESANNNPAIKRIVFKRNATISLTAPVIYNGKQRLSLHGNGATIDGSGAGYFVLDDDLTAVTEDGSLVFNTAGDITIRRLTVANSATRGIVVNIPEDASGADIRVTLDGVKVTDSALFGLHIDDNSDAFDDGDAGSEIGIDLTIRHSSFVGNGTGAIDFDGVRVDERGEGDINAMIINSHIDANGGDGIELDEAGTGDVDATMIRVTINDNGFYNEEDLDDGFDIDEAGDGDIDVSLFNVKASNNQDEGLDFDEAGDGDIQFKGRYVKANNNTDEGIKLDEEDGGNITVKMSAVESSGNGDDGMQLTELGSGFIAARLHRVSAVDNAKYGIKMEQWVEEDEVATVETAGILKARKVNTANNGSGDDIELNNIIQK